MLITVCIMRMDNSPKAQSMIFERLFEPRMTMSANVDSLTFTNHGYADGTPPVRPAADGEAPSAVPARRRRCLAMSTVGSRGRPEEWRYRRHGCLTPS